MATGSIFCKKEGLLFCLKSTVSLTFLLGAIKRALGVFTGECQQLGDLILDKRTFSVSTVGYSPWYLKREKKSCFNIKAALTESV